MARDYISIGPTPAAEDCQQVGPTYDHTAARAECRRFLELIRETVGPEPIGARLAVKSNPHDFGSYLEVVCYYDDENETATKYAFRCETDAPEHWPAPTATTTPDGPRFQVATIHGQSVSLFHVIDTAQPADEQPAIVHTSADRDHATTAAEAYHRGAECPTCRNPHPDQDAQQEAHQ